MADDVLDTAIAELDGARPPVALLDQLGDPEPLRAANAVAEAAGHPELASTRRDWLPPLLASARPGLGAQRLVELSERVRSASGRPLDADALPALARVLGSSPFLGRMLAQHPQWARELRGSPPPPPSRERVTADWDAIRAAKYRGLLRIAARDLAGRPLEQSCAELTELADACLAAALECASRETGVPAPALIALGKLGGRELNFASDVDLLFVYEAPSERDDFDLNSRVTKLIRKLKTQLEARTAEGFGYRVDLDLRPEGRTGPLTNSVDAALGYYESFGADWERQMLIRARRLAGPREPGQRFLREVAPFVYRTLIDPGAIAAVRAMKTRIESERRRAGVDLDADLKEGPGGIRDVEFLVQALQLFHGGRDASLRTGNAFAALTALERARILTPRVTASVADAYAWLRRAEHALQLEEERQTHRFPRERGAQLQLARRMGYADSVGRRARDRLLEDWTHVRAEVRLHFDALVLAPEESA